VVFASHDTSHSMCVSASMYQEALYADLTVWLRRKTRACLCEHVSRGAVCGLDCVAEKKDTRVSLRACIKRRCVRT
jgi:hypothetical protein